jgi:hypothetical protein
MSKAAGLCCGVGVALALALAPAAAAAIRYAEPGGTGAEPCNPDPCTLPNAVEGHNPGTDVHAGDQVRLLAGPYHPGSTVEVNDAIDVGPAPGVAPPLIDYTGTNEAVGLYAAATLHDVRISDTGSYGALFIGQFAGPSATVERVVASSTRSGCEVLSGVVRDSVCVTSAGSYAGLCVCFNGAGSFNAQARNVTAVKTSVVGGSTAVAVQATTGHAELDGTNVIALSPAGFQDVSAYQASGGTGVVSLQNSNYAAPQKPGGGTVTPVGTNGNQTAAPLLSADYHELPGSPTIDAGLAAPDIGSLDLDRNPRISPLCLGGGEVPDIGAYELPTASPPAPACSVFEIGGLQRNKKKGKGALTVTVPGSGLLAATGKGLKKTSASPAASGDVILNLKASGKSRRKLARGGRAKLKITLSWTPSGGSASTQTDKVKLVRK